MTSPYLLVRCLQGKKESRVPFWFMRQAGRYLPEYRKTRELAGGFLDLCYTPDLATEVTLQPIRRYAMDAAIIFSDILVIPQALGVALTFEAGEGPKLERLESSGDIQRLSAAHLTERLQPVYQALRQTRAALPADVALIGFAGAPWTLACYMLEGGGSKDFARAKAFAFSEPAAFAQLLRLLEEAIVTHLSHQIQAGANAVQLFDSWAAAMPASHLDTFVVAPHRRIAAALKKNHPDIPLIGFPRGIGAAYPRYAADAHIDGISIDYTVPIEIASAQLSLHATVQGNLDPLLLAHDLPGALAEAKRIVTHFADKPLVFNLGHGMVPATPPDHVAALSDVIRNHTA